MFLASIGKDSVFTSSFANQASDEFKRKVRWKVQFILDALSYGYKVLYMDSDVILLKNPFPILKSYKQYDIVAQRDGKDQWNICTGFFYLNPTKEAMDVVKYSKDLVYHHDYRDQASIIAAAKALKPSLLLLPNTLFPSGLDFFSKYQYYWDRKGVNE